MGMTFKHYAFDVPPSTSFELLPANANRRMLIIHVTSGTGNTLVSLNGATLTSINPSPTNLGMPVSGTSYYNSAQYINPNTIGWSAYSVPCPSGAITAYHANVGNRVIQVIEGL